MSQRVKKAARNRLGTAAAVAAAAVLATSGFARAATFTYTPAEASNTAVAPDNWSAGAAAGWDVTPASAADTTLILNGPTTNGVTRFTANDIASPPFQLNVLTLQGTGPSGASATATLTVQGSGLDLRSNGATLPTVNLNTNRSTTGSPAPTYNVVVANALTLTNDTTFGGNGNATLFNFTGAIGGPGALTKTGTSVMQVSSTSNNYAGATNVSAGTLQIGTSNVIPNGSAVNVSGTGVFNFVGRNETFASLAITGTGLINSTAGIVSVTGALTNSSTSTGGSGAAFVVNSAGRVTIGGMATFNAGSQSLIGGGGGTRLNFNGGVTFTGATLRVNTGSDSRITLGGDVTVNDPGNATSSGITSSAGGTVANPLDLNGGNRTFTVADGSAPVDFTVGAVLTSVAGTGAVTKSGPGVMALTNPGNNYTGGTTITAGSLAPQANDALGTGGVTVLPGAVLDLSSTLLTTGAVADAATLTLSNTGGTFAMVAFGTSTLDETVGQLLVNGTPQAPGTYTAGSLPNFITGSGSITVVPEPAALGVIGLGVVAVLRRRRTARA